MSMELDSVRSSEIIKDSNDKKCAPSKVFKDGSCIPLSILVKMAEAYNDMAGGSSNGNKSSIIKLYPSVETANPNKYKRYLLKEFSGRLSEVCDNQRCWLKQDFMSRLADPIQKELMKNTYRPSGPNGRFTWLNTLDINKAMSQYQKMYKGFRFLGAVPMDFDEIPIPKLDINGIPQHKSDESEEYYIRDLDFKKLYNEEGIDKLGVIFNLDTSKQRGSHWVAGYYDLGKGQVYYYDSYGEHIDPSDPGSHPVPAPVRKLMRRVARAIPELSGIPKNKIDIRHNKVRHQFKNSECGVFSMSFILRLLKGKTFDEIANSKVYDDEINKCRDLYFIKENKS
jgi:hypothetical protein